MNFSYQLPIASMMVLLFLSGLSVVRSGIVFRSEESHKDVQKVSNKIMGMGLFGKAVPKKIESTSTCTYSYQNLGGTTYTCYDLSSCDATCTQQITYNGYYCCYGVISNDECAPGCPDNWINDGWCDSTCNNAACNYDGNDCNDDNGNDDMTAANSCSNMNLFGITFCNSWSSPTGLFSLTFTNYDTLPSTTYIISDSLWNQAINDDDFDAGSYIDTEDLYICTGTYDSTNDWIYPADGGCNLSKQKVDKGKTYYLVTTSTDYYYKLSFPLSDGAVAGIVIGVLVFLGCCCGGLAFLIMNNKKRTAQPQTTVIAMGPGQVTQNPTIMTTNAV